MGTSKDDRERAEAARLRKEQNAAQAREKAEAEQAAQAQAVEDKTSRLRSLRLMKQAADQDTQAKADPAATKQTPQQ
jgi:hypothetical protein